ncbi:SDR family NAD(P)-dependent oxidoreductase, partial [Aeromonas hydrophila]
MKKVALITGARGGIGSAITTALLAQGYRIIATHSSPNGAAAHDWYGEQGFRPDQVRLLALDVADTAMCRDTLGRLLQDEGRVDVLVNNAGITRDGAFKRMTPEQWFEVIHTNLCSLYNVTQPLFDAMCEQRDARIINISSVNGQKGQFGQVNYSAAKAGMLGFTKALAAEGA